MNEPPPLPRGDYRLEETPPAHDLLGAIALAVGIICSGITAAAFYLWRDIGLYRASLPAYATEGAAGFSLHFYPWVLTLGSIALGVLTLTLLVASIVCRHPSSPRPTVIRVGAALTLLPFLYLVVSFAIPFFQAG